MPVLHIQLYQSKDPEMSQGILQPWPQAGYAPCHCQGKGHVFTIHAGITQQVTSPSKHGDMHATQQPSTQQAYAGVHRQSTCENK